MAFTGFEENGEDGLTPEGEGLPFGEGAEDVGGDGQAGGRQAPEAAIMAKYGNDPAKLAQALLALQTDYTRAQMSNSNLMKHNEQLTQAFRLPSGADADGDDFDGDPKKQAGDAFSFIDPAAAKSITELLAGDNPETGVQEFGNLVLKGVEQVLAQREQKAQQAAERERIDQAKHHNEDMMRLRVVQYLRNDAAAQNMPYRHFDQNYEPTDDEYNAVWPQLETDLREMKQRIHMPGGKLMPEHFEMLDAWKSVKSGNRNANNQPRNTGREQMRSAAGSFGRGSRPERTFVPSMENEIDDGGFGGLSENASAYESMDYFLKNPQKMAKFEKLLNGAIR